MQKVQRRKRAKIRIRKRSAPGASPGTIAVDPAAALPEIHVLAYGPDRILEQDVTDLATIPELLREWPVTWVNLSGLGDPDTLRAIGALFQLHRLALEDVVNVSQRAKFEEYASNLYLVCRVPSADAGFATEQLSIFLGPNYVLTFQERAGDCLAPVRDRIRNLRGQIRTRGADYLAYAITDAVVDTYFPILEEYGERLDSLEMEVAVKPTTQTLSQIQHAKRELLALRRSIWPHRDMLTVLLRDPTTLISDGTRVYWRDVHDHAVQIMDLVDTYRELGSAVADFYLSSVSLAMNDVMKVLTVIATIFIPLTFIAGIYGMNFERHASPWNMPELGWYWGYPLSLLLMAAVAFLSVWYFKHKGWLGSKGTGS